MNGPAAIFLAGILSVFPFAGVRAQETTTASEPEGTSTILVRTAALTVADVPLGAALDALQAASRVPIAYSSTLLPEGRSVTCDCEEVSVAEALDRFLEGTDLEAAVMADQVVIRARSASALASAESPSQQVVQQASLQGLVTDEVDSAALDGVSIVLEREGVTRTTITDRNGYYQIGGVDPGGYLLRVQRLGYVSRLEAVVLQEDEQRTINLALAQDPVVLEGIVVQAPGIGPVRRELGRQVITSTEIGRIPVPAGSGDLATYLQTLPGVVTTGDRGGQLFIRGGTPAENLILVDGLPIYQPFHILGFFSVFPEDLVSNVDFYPGGFGSRYIGRTSSVVDVHMRDGDRSALTTGTSVSPFLADVRAEGPLGDSGGGSWIVSVRRSLVDETTPWLIGERQPLDFESQYARVGLVDDETGSRCSALGMRTSDRGRLDPQQADSHVSWGNFVVGGRCVMLFRDSWLRLVEASFGFTSAHNDALSHGVAELGSDIKRLYHEAHVTTLAGALPVYAGYSINIEILEADLAELFGLQSVRGSIFGMAGYVETEKNVGERVTLRPGMVIKGLPRPGIEPRVRASWRPWGGDDKEVQAALGLYRQDLTAISDTRDVGSVFMAWIESRDDKPQESVHATLGWQQSLGSGMSWSLEGYYKWIKNVPVPLWRATAEFTTQLGRANGRSYGADLRMEYRGSRAYGLLGYGYSWTQYEAAQRFFTSWFGEPVQRYHPPHDRRHQLNAIMSLDVKGFTAGVRWYLGSGLPYTRPLGFDEAFDFRFNLDYVGTRLGSPRLILDRPYRARLPAVHRLDVSLERSIDLSFGRLDIQAGAMNLYDRRNLFYYDLFTNHRVDQLPLVPYLSLKLGTP